MGKPNLVKCFGPRNNTPGTSVAPGSCDRILAVKIRKTPEKIILKRKKLFMYLHIPGYPRSGWKVVDCRFDLFGGDIGDLVKIPECWLEAKNSVECRSTFTQTPPPSRRRRKKPYYFIMEKNCVVSIWLFSFDFDYFLFQPAIDQPYWGKNKSTLTTEL